MSSAFPPPQEPYIGRRLLLRLALTGMAAYLACVLMLTFMQRSMTYFPARESALEPDRSGLPRGQVHSIQLRTGDELTLHGWHVLPADQRAADREQADQRLAAGGPVILYFSGNGGNRGFRGDELEVLAEAGCHVLLFDYRGYAENPGRPSEAYLAADALAVWRYATQTRRVQAERIVLFGESLGGGVAVGLAAELCRLETPPAGLILRSTFSSLVDVAAHHYPWLPVRLLMLDRYASIDRISQVTCPILQIHGRRDRIVPQNFGQRLFAAAPEHSAGGVAKHWVELPSADHNDVIFTERPGYSAALREILGEITPSRNRGGHAEA